MFRTIAISLIALLFPVLLSCEKEPAETIPDPSQEEQTDSEGGNDNNGKTLVVFYSFTGNCKTLSSALARYAEADMLEIQPAEDGLDYAANNYAIGSRLIAAIREKPNEATSYPAIKPVDRNVADYETIIIITPLWWGNMAAIMQSYLFKEGSKMSDKKIGLIVSSASSSISSVVADVKRLVPDAQWMGEALWINNSNRNKSDELIKEWWNGLSKSKDNMPNEIKITVSKKTLSVKIEDNAATKACRCPSGGLHFL